MKEVWKAAVTIWCLCLSMLFVFGFGVAFLTTVSGFALEKADMCWVGILSAAAFIWGVFRYNSKFIARVEQVQKNTDRFKDWDD